jgi:hypothetical protein
LFYTKWLYGLEDLRRESTIYLLPEYDTEEEARGSMREYCSEIFEQQLDGWYRVPSAWPVDRTLDAFTGGLSTGFVPGWSISAMIR